MPVRTDPARPDWRELLDADGERIGRFLYVERDGRTIADLFALDSPVERAVPVIARELKGWRVAGGERLGQALLEAGARLGRHAHLMTHDLRDVGPGRGEPFDHAAADLVPAYLAAYGPGHPDSAAREGEDPHAELEKILSGDELGPVLDCSGVALDGQRVVAAIVVTDCPGEPPHGGPWVAELFRDPAHPGAGRALLARALHRAAETNLPAVSLAVTHGNPAIRLYEALGFRRVMTAISVDL